MPARAESGVDSDLEAQQAPRASAAAAGQEGKEAYEQLQEAQLEAQLRGLLTQAPA
jgi:hypothetical protein